MRKLCAIAAAKRNTIHKCERKSKMAKMMRFFVKIPFIVLGVAGN
jgi:hypothetical protein